MLRAFLQHDRAAVSGCLVAVILLAWGYLFLGVGIETDTMDMGGQTMLMAPHWSVGYGALIFLMWAIMMVAMMLPSVAPTVLLVAALARGRRSLPSAGLFALGYVLIWTGFSLVATLLQWGLDSAGMLSKTMATTSAFLAGIVLIAAGVYQWTPLKQACLRHCRSPLAFLTHHWRQGSWGAVTNGFRHGLFCLGCCWMLMAMLFVGGLMNLLWIAGLAVLVLIEKTVPWGGRMGRVTGVALIVWGVITLASAYQFDAPSAT
jgi:predicted metal-binding membrane protein